MPQDAAQRLELRPLGGLDEAWAEATLRLLSRRLSLPCHLSWASRGMVAPLLPHREQGDGEALLRTLETQDTAPGTLLLAVTDQDLALPIFTFVFGLAREGGRVALVSLVRLDPAFYGLPAATGLIPRRLLAEALHEMGHLAGLHHCQQPDCLMRFAGNVEAVDVRGDHFCADCEARLPAWMQGRHPSWLD